jgi:hypothetical protein
LRALPFCHNGASLSLSWFVVLRCFPPGIPSTPRRTE